MNLLHLSTHITLINVCISLQVLQLEAPAFVKLGQPLHLKCEFDLGGKKLYSIKWFHGPVEIFSYISSQTGEAHYTFVSDYSPGVNITNYHVTPESSCELTMGKTYMGTSGLFTCLITGGDIPFKEDSDTKTIQVAVPPSSPPSISGVLSSYTPGDFVNLNCSTFNSTYVPRLKWILNHEEVTEFGMERQYPSVSDQYFFKNENLTLFTTILGLQFWLTDKHFKDGKLLVSCKAFITDIYNMSSDSYTIGRYTEPLQYLETKSGAICKYYNPIALLGLLLGILINRQSDVDKPNVVSNLLLLLMLTQNL